MLFDGITYECIDRYAGLFGKDGYPVMNVRSEPYVECPRIAFMRFDTLFFTICKIILNSFMERIGKFGHTFSFKIDETVNPFDLSEKHTVGFAESY